MVIKNIKTQEQGPQEMVHHVGHLPFIQLAWVQYPAPYMTLQSQLE